ncbi:conserved hypothetical protein [Perkinsus marinus ATCC 50983]|uniref:EamA domain-containing protein n=1 Tax=Perkinsus marinus (strain ATCC 50983 / TXsc) TaxID=423536 RepID=C5KGQ2_PERM5|nr:conserved hypothetical protein [Perkinsus marinus ATCC 50983]EER16320.1 conserved hypothetical protein [Perkinsus marinus ATCC 50983]|eukprot:XP_002784524.1 conserved hypothetical protein [Perkinsus marinus ATCC 50983]
MGRTTFYILGLLIFGCLNTIMSKVQFQIISVGIEGHTKFFKKPWFNTLTMFLGMCIVLAIHFITVCYNRQSSRRSQQPLLTHHQHPETSFKKASWLIAFPAALDLIATVFCFLGLLYNSASVYQMLRGSMIIFSAIFSVMFLKRQLRLYHWFGVLICVAAVIVVGVAGMKSTTTISSPTDTGLRAFGMAMIILGQIVQALQVVVEERLLRHHTIAPFLITGMEGIWGTLLMLIIAFPIIYLIPGNDAGSAENPIDTMVMIDNSTSLQWLILLYIFSVFTYNMSGMLVTFALSAVHRTMLEASRTAVIWIVDLIIHAIAPESVFGEVWTMWSWLQLFGFGLLIFGQAVYSDIIRIPGFYYDRAPPKPEHLRSPAAMMSNVPTPPPSIRHRENPVD